jgi:hypothetical protein
MDIEIKRFTDIIKATHEIRGDFKRDNYFRLNGTLLYVKISRSQPSFFGISKSMIEILNNESNFFLILLTSECAGWAYSKNEIRTKIKKHDWRYTSRDNEYKINIGSIQSDDENYFPAFKQFLEKYSEIIGVL